METIQLTNLTPNTAAMQLKYNYDQLDSDTAITTRSAAIEIKTNAERAKASMIAIGQKLTAVKGLLQHGQFEDWCSVEFDMSQRTAQRMMAAAEVFGGRNDTVSLLSDSVMYMLSGPSVPEAARVEVIEQAKATGESPTKAEVQAVIDKHKPDEELRDKCNKIEFWLMGKGWSGFGRKNEEGKLISGVQKGEHRFVWLDDDWADAYDKVRAAEKIERAALASFIKLTPPKNDTVSPLKPSAPTPLTGEETRAMIWRALREDGPAKDANADPQECKAWLYRNGEPKDYIKFIPMHRSIDQYTFNVEINMARRSLDADEQQPAPQPSETEEQRSNRIRQELRDDMSAYLKKKFAATPEPPPDRPLPGWVDGEPDKPFMDEDEGDEAHTSATVDLSQEKGENRSSMAQPEPTDRQFQIKLVLAAFQVAQEKLDDYGQLTGHFTDIPPAQRILEKLIKNLQDNLAQ